MELPRHPVCACWYSLYARVDKAWRIVNAAYLDGAIDTRRAVYEPWCHAARHQTQKESQNREVPGEMS